MTRATLAQASAWLLALRVPFASNESSTESKLIVRPIAASMLKSYDASAFRAESREAVAATLKFFREPDIRERLDVWVRINAPETVEVMAPEALVAPIEHSARWDYSRFLRAPDDTTAIRALGALRSREPVGFDWVVRNDHAAAGYAVQRGWRPTPTDTELASDWDDEVGIRAKARQVRALPRGTPFEAAVQDRALHLLVYLVKTHAPQHFDLLLDELRGEVVPVPVAFPPEVTLYGEIL